MRNNITSSNQAKILVKQLEMFDSHIGRKIEKNKKGMGEKLERDVNYSSATMDYLNHHLPSWQRGYKDMFVKLVPIDKERAPDYKTIKEFREVFPNIELEKDGSCPFVLKYNLTQGEMMEDEIEEIKYFLSKDAHHDVGEALASMSFYKNIFPEWASGARYFIETKGCPLRSICGDSSYNAEKEKSPGFASAEKEDAGLVSKL